MHQHRYLRESPKNFWSVRSARVALNATLNGVIFIFVLSLSLTNTRIPLEKNPAQMVKKIMLQSYTVIVFEIESKRKLLLKLVGLFG
jgi:hypothetical protein